MKKYITKKDLVLPKRKEDSHKGENGKLLIIGGCEDYPGAVALAGLAALRSGCDYVTVAVPEKVGYVINSITPDLVVRKFKGGDLCVNRVKDVLKLEKDHDVVLIGNGIGMHAKSFVKKYVTYSVLPKVIDADALKHIRLQDVCNAVLTPHKKELEILLNNSDLNMGNLKKNLGSNVFVIKGQIDEVISKNEVRYNKTGNPGMTKAGTGDVLAGLIAGFLCQGLTKEQAAINGVFISGLAGDKLLKEKKWYSFIASDLLEKIPYLLH